MKNTNSKASVIYVNFSQYDNAGRILDYLRERFDTVLHFSFDHLRLKNGRKTNLITLYKRGQPSITNTLFSLRVPSYFLFLSLPVVGILMVIQTVRQSYRFRNQLGQPEFFTVNAYPALIGIILKAFGVVTRVTYWVWDYFPVRGPSLPLRIIRYAYLIFDIIALRLSDSLVFPNRRQMNVRKSLHGIRGNFRVIPLGGPKPIRYHTKTFCTFGFLGMIKGSQGLELALKSFGDILISHPNMTLEIIGSGPEEESMKNIAKPYGKRVKFYGFIEQQDTIDRIVKRWFAGLAIYEPVTGNESYFGDPSKIKVYLSQGVPIITTNVTEYGAKARRLHIGITIPYRKQDLLLAVHTLYKKQHTYRKHALRFAKQLYYRTLYHSLFLHR